MKVRKAAWLLPPLITLIVLSALLILADGGSVSEFFYKSF